MEGKMKTKGLLFALILFISSTVVQAQSVSKMFDRFSNDKDITSIFISKAMLGSMSSDQNINGIDINGLKGKLDQIEIYTSKKTTACESFRSEMGVVQKGKAYELLMSIKEGDNKINFFAQKEHDKFKELIMFVDQSTECVVIRILGLFTPEDIEKITKNVK